MEIAKVVAIAVIGVAAMVALTVVNGNREDAINASAIRYEECVKEEYGMHPVQWYVEHGEYPECSK